MGILEALLGSSMLCGTCLAIVLAPVIIVGIFALALLKVSWDLLISLLKVSWQLLSWLMGVFSELLVRLLVR